MCTTGSSISSGLLPQFKNDSDFHSAFNVIDVDGDGKISREDLRTFCEGISSSEDVIESMMLHADSNKDGYVEYEEFEKTMISVWRNLEEDLKRRRLSLMEDVFRLMDKDGDGKVGHEDLKSYLKCAGFDANDEDVKAMVKLGRGEGNAGVTFPDFLNIFFAL